MSEETAAEDAGAAEDEDGNPRGPDRRDGSERRQGQAPIDGPDRRLAERRTGLDRRMHKIHYEALTQHPRPARNINDYPLSTDEVEFINAVNDYKSKFDRPFPTWSEVLHILRTLGYERIHLPAHLTPAPDLVEGEEASAAEGESASA
ncbi:MAG: hypothetical protein ACYTDX_02145 [Planctomycetota bacterium]